MLQWVAKEAGVPLNSDSGWPEGTFNYTGDREYTPDEAIELVNSVLLTKNYTLLRPAGRLVLIPLGPLQDRVPRVNEDELDKKGDHEFVMVVFHLGNANLGELKPRLRGCVAVMVRGRPAIGTADWDGIVGHRLGRAREEDPRCD